MNSIRATNLCLARYLNFGHNNTAAKVRGVVNSNYLSRMALGDMKISDYSGRSIERVLELPKGWLDQDNSKFLNLTDEQYTLLTLVRDLPRSKQLALQALLGSGENPTSLATQPLDCLAH